MPNVTLKAHFDGQQILLDEPYALPNNCSLFITVLREQSSERSDFSAIAISSLAKAYSDEEPEYLLSDLRS